MRAIDLFSSILGLALLSPVLIFLAILIKLTSRGPVFYCSKRVGKDEKLFYMLKFRSMVINAEKMGSIITASGDSRITSLGRFLRKTKLDELPQLFNVLKGEMSLVGPRPEDPQYVALYAPAQHQIFKVRPGITSAASLAYRHEERMLSGKNWDAIYRNEVLPDKLAIDLEYLSHRTIWSDLKLIIRTLVAVVK